MKNTYTYYLAILLPLALIIPMGTYKLIEPPLFMGILLFYVLIYRTYTDGKRLAEKGLIPDKGSWKVIIPGSRLKYFKALYLP